MLTKESLYLYFYSANNEKSSDLIAHILNPFQAMKMTYCCYHICQQYISHTFLLHYQYLWHFIVLQKRKLTCNVLTFCGSSLAEIMHYLGNTSIIFWLKESPA